MSTLGYGNKVLMETSEVIIKHQTNMPIRGGYKLETTGTIDHIFRANLHEIVDYDSAADVFCCYFENYDLQGCLLIKITYLKRHHTKNLNLERDF
jgi:hypothetical protein